MLLLLLFLNIFFTKNDGKSKAWKRKIIKDIINLFRQEKVTKAIKDRIIINIKNLFQHEEENYYKPVRLNHFLSNSYIGYDMKIMVIEVKRYQLRTIWTELYHI